MAQLDHKHVSCEACDSWQMVTLDGQVTSSRGMPQCFLHALQSDCDSCVTQHYDCLQKYHKEALRQLLRPMMRDPTVLFSTVKKAVVDYRAWSLPGELFPWLAARHLHAAARALLRLRTPAQDGSRSITHFQAFDLDTFRQACTFDDMINTYLLTKIRQDPQRAGFSVAQCRVMAEHVQAHPEAVVMWRYNDEYGSDYSCHLDELKPSTAAFKELQNCLEAFVTWCETL